MPTTHPNLLRPLPVRTPERVVVPRTFDRSGTELALWPDELAQLAHETRTLGDVGGFAHWGAHEAPMKSVPVMASQSATPAPAARSTGASHHSG